MSGKSAPGGAAAAVSVRGTASRCPGRFPVSADLSSVIAATAQWLLRAYPPERGPLSAALAEAQCRQAATVAAWLRYPTALDAGLLDVVGPGGSGRLDW